MVLFISFMTLKLRDSIWAFLIMVKLFAFVLFIAESASLMRLIDSQIIFRLVESWCSSRGAGCSRG